MGNKKDGRKKRELKDRRYRGEPPEKLTAQLKEIFPEVYS